MPRQTQIHRRGQNLGVQVGRALLRVARDQLREVRQHHYGLSLGEATASKKGRRWRPCYAVRSRCAAQNFMLRPKRTVSSFGSTVVGSVATMPEVSSKL